jgi:hypothetical protein
MIIIIYLKKKKKVLFTCLKTHQYFINRVERTLKKIFVRKKKGKEKENEKEKSHNFVDN